MDIREIFIRGIVNPIVWRFIKGSHRFNYFHLMRKKQWKSLEKNRKEQATRLFQLIRYCDKNIPYYSHMIKEKKIHYSKSTIFEDIKKFPVLTKDIIRNNFKDLINKDVKRKYKKETSGGSMGEPITILHDNVFLDYIAATKSLFNSWAGRKEGEYMIQFWGSERDILKGGQGLTGWLVRNMMNVELLNTFRVSEDDIGQFVSIINKKRPKIILAYVQSAYDIARSIKNKKLSVYSPKSIMTSAGTLYPDFKKVISEVFNCPIFNRYGSREVGDMACDCNMHKGLHVNIFNHYIEVLDDELTEVSVEGGIGEIYVTTLHNKVMPLIRYKIGDVAAVTLKKCPCGRGMPLIKTVKGRDVEIFINGKNEKVDGEYFTHLLYFRKWVKQFQIVQERKNLININIVKKSKEVLKKDISEIEKGIWAVMGKKCKIEWNFIQKIKPTKSGKYVYTLSKVKR